MNKEMTANNCLNMQYVLLKGMFFDDKKETDNYILCTSKVMDDFFWNITYIKNRLDKKMLTDLEAEFKSIHRTSSIYIGTNDKYYNENKQMLLTNGYTLNNTDVYMLLENPVEIDITTDIKIVENEKEYNDFMKVLSSAYNDVIENPDENVYADAVTECYYDAVKNTLNSKEHIHIIVYDNNTPVSVATLNYVNGIAGINNVGTAQGYWNKGYGKQLMTYLIKKFQSLGGGLLTLSTEYHSKNKLEQTADYIEEGEYRELVWSATEQYPATTLDIEIGGTWHKVYRIMADDIAFEHEPQNPEDIFFLNMAE